MKSWSVARGIIFAKMQNIKATKDHRSVFQKPLFTVTKDHRWIFQKPLFTVTKDHR